MPIVSIFMATFNGEKYLDEQLASIFNQTYKEFRLIVTDDCSTDSTISIIKKWIRLYPNQITLIERKENSGKPQITFMQMVNQFKDTEYYMFCDQDDVWFPDKIVISLNALKKIENKHGQNTPVLLGTEFVLTDKTLVPFRKQKKRLNYDKYCKSNKVICYNLFTGCTVIFNHALSKIICIEDDPGFIHDWYIAFVASIFGVVGIIPDATIYYRQHESNAIGYSTTMNLIRLIKKLKRSLQTDYYLLAKRVYEKYSEKMDTGNQEMIRDFISIPNKGIAFRLKAYSKYKYWSPGIIRRIFQLVR